MQGQDPPDLTSPAKSPPRLVVVRQQTPYLKGFILADSVSVACSGNDVFDCLLSLLAAYYAWDLSFPRMYQVLAFLQHYMLGDTKAVIHRGTAFSKLEKAMGLGTQKFP